MVNAMNLIMDPSKPPNNSIEQYLAPSRVNWKKELIFLEQKIDEKFKANQVEYLAEPEDLKLLIRFFSNMSATENYTLIEQAAIVILRICRKSSGVEQIIGCQELLNCIWSLVYINEKSVIICYTHLLKYLITVYFCKDTICYHELELTMWLKEFFKHGRTFEIYGELMSKSSEMNIIILLVGLVKNFGKLLNIMPKDDSEAFKTVFFVNGLVLGVYDGILNIFPKLLDLQLLPEMEIDLKVQFKVLHDFLDILLIFLDLHKENRDIMKFVLQDYVEIVDAIINLNFTDHFLQIKGINSVLFRRIVKHTKYILLETRCKNPELDL